MERFFSDVRDGAKLRRDDVGIELRDAEVAHIAALEGAKETARSRLHRLRPVNRTTSIVVTTDSRRNVVYTLVFADIPAGSIVA